MTSAARANSASDRACGSTGRPEAGQPPRASASSAGEVRQHEVRARPLDRGDLLEGHGRPVDPAALGGGLDHRVLARHVVGGDGHVDGGPHLGQHVEVGERRLDHDHVGALGHVEGDLGQRLAPVAVVLLVALAVAPAHDGDVGGLAERAVEGRRVLGGVGQHRGPGVPGPVEGTADGGHLSVHHPARGDHVGAGRRLHDGQVGVELDRGVVVDLAGVGVEHAAVAVVGELVEAAVGHDHQVVADRAADGLDGPPGDAVGVQGGGAGGVLVLGAGQREEDDTGHAQSDQAPGLGDQRVDGVLGHPGQRPHGPRGVESVGHEQGGHQVVDDSAVSATSRRSAGVRRRRRRRRTGNPGGGRRSGTAPQPTAPVRRSRPRPARSRASAVPRASTTAATSPSRVCTTASAATVRPAARTAPDVTGPIDDHDPGDPVGPEQVHRALDGGGRGERHRVGGAGPGHGCRGPRRPPPCGRRRPRRPASPWPRSPGPTTSRTRSARTNSAAPSPVGRAGRRALRRGRREHGHQCVRHRVGGHQVGDDAPGHQRLGRGRAHRRPPGRGRQGPPGEGVHRAGHGVHRGDHDPSVGPGHGPVDRRRQRRTPVGRVVDGDDRQLDDRRPEPGQELHELGGLGAGPGDDDGASGQRTRRWWRDGPAGRRDRHRGRARSVPGRRGRPGRRPPGRRPSRRARRPHRSRWRRGPAGRPRAGGPGRCAPPAAARWCPSGRRPPAWSPRRPAASSRSVMAARAPMPMRTTRVPSNRPSASQSTPGSDGSPAWPVTTVTEVDTFRWVTGMPAAAGAANAELTPGTTSTATPARRRASASSPPRPNTNGSPPSAGRPGGPTGRGARAAR